MSNGQKKILLISNLPLARAGVQAVIMNTVRNLSAEYTFDILLLSEKKACYDEEFLSFGGKIFRIKDKKGAFWSRADYYIRALRLYKETRRILKENGPYEAVHCHCHLEAGPCLAAAKKAGVPLRIAHTHIVHTKAHPISRLYDRVYRLLIERNANCKLGCSEIANHTFYKNSDDARVLNNPYDTERFCYEKYPHVTPSTPAIVQTGSFSDNKNQLFSLDIISEIKKEYPSVRFDMVGFDHGGILDKIKAKISELGLEENVTIHPSDADTAELYAKASYTLFPSKREGFGIVAVEAQAMGVKCFASDTVPKSTNCGGCEYLPLSAGATAWAERIISDFKETGGRHSQYDCSAFAMQKITDQYRKIYQGASS